MGYGEATQEKKVVLIEFNSTTPNIQELPVPCFQELVRIVGSLDDIHAKLEELKKEESSAWLEIEYTGSDYVKFMPPSDLNRLNLDYIFAADWKHPNNQIEEWRHSSAKCAEVLVPERVPPNYLLGAYVVDEASQVSLKNAGFNLPIRVDSTLFFR